MPLPHKKERCKRISFEAYTREDLKYITSYNLENQPPSAEDVITRQQLNKILLARMRTLPPRYVDMICMYFGINEQERDYTYKEIALQYNICSTRAQQIILGALRRLRHPSNNQHFRIFLVD